MICCTFVGPESFSANWFREILNQIIQNTPHSWPENTLNCFPQTLREYFQQTVVQKEDKQMLKRNVDTEYRKWKSKLTLHFFITTVCRLV